MEKEIIDGTWRLVEVKDTQHSKCWLTIRAGMSFLEAFMLMGEYADTHKAGNYRIVREEKEGQYSFNTKK